MKPSPVQKDVENRGGAGDGWTRIRALKVIPAFVGIACFGVALVSVALGVLGFLGALADVGPEENRKIGFGFLRFGLPWFGGGTVLCVTSLLANRRKAVRELGDR